MTQLRKLYIDGPAGKLECLLRVHPNPRAVALVAHPHPMHGGTMNNAVIFHTDRMLHRAGMTTLRFNFRGAGESEGPHDHGQGEVGDVAAAASWLRGVAPEAPQLIVGYSFGSWCGIRFAKQSTATDGFIAIGLPVRRFEFEDLNGFPLPLAVIQGSEDEFGTPEEVEPLLKTVVGPTWLHVIADAPHLFPKRAREPAEKVLEAANQILDSLPPSVEP